MAESNGSNGASPDLRKLLDLIGAGRDADARTADWDAAIARRKPSKFKFLGLWWEVKSPDFRELAAMFELDTYAGLSDKEATAKQLDFIGRHTTDPATWAKKTAGAKIAPSSALGGLHWILKKEAGVPLEIADGGDPLEAPSASSASAGGNGRSSAGGSRKSASKTR